jgi:hypothetical protein
MAYYTVTILKNEMEADVTEIITKRNKNKK